MSKRYPIVSDDYITAICKARKKLMGVIYAKKLAPLMLRLAWNSAATFDVITRTGGPFGTMRLEAEQNHDANIGLTDAVQCLGDIKKQFRVISYADLYQLAGVVAVEITGGPEIPFHPGREDKPEPPPEGRLPACTKGYCAIINLCLYVCFRIYGVLDLWSCGHTLGQCYVYNSGYHGSWTGTPDIFDKSYFEYVFCY
ncbi:L-ascorbate peroxidase 2, cytosolic-like [Cannabis sativa]|uniref:L-ascorbate peroxidase 2, cytosolic-like n=1 Tax=Cannabis sativa TaxID=3483 RepID=UPI0029CA8D9C|nr:L-ascorbate peroxidase 2, cytosolic-like [Cannabis sativa]